MVGTHPTIVNLPSSDAVPMEVSIAVHNVMVANKSTNTKPELFVREALRSAGFPGYRLHWRIDGEGGRYLCRPDISFPGRKLAVFVHGCFWHRCPRCNLGLPKSNVDYWIQKFDKNGTYLLKWGGSSQSANGKFYYAWGIAIDNADKVYVADRDPHRVQLFDNSGTYLNFK